MEWSSIVYYIMYHAISVFLESFVIYIVGTVALRRPLIHHYLSGIISHNHEKALFMQYRSQLCVNLNTDILISVTLLLFEALTIVAHNY